MKFHYKFSFVIEEYLFSDLRGDLFSKMSLFIQMDFFFMGYYYFLFFIIEQDEKLRISNSFNRILIIIIKKKIWQTQNINRQQQKSHQFIKTQLLRFVVSKNCKTIF